MTEKQDDLNLPAAVVTRIIKEALPDGCNVAKDAKLALARAASVFVLYLTAQANTVALERNRKTITNRDVLEALQITEFGRFEEPLNEALQQFRQIQQSRKDKKISSKEEQKPGDNNEDGDVEIEEVEVEVEDDVEMEEDPDVTSCPQ